MGDTDKITHDSFRYYVRTSENGASLGDTSNFMGSPNDFAYKFDTTCESSSPYPRVFRFKKIV